MKLIIHIGYPKSASTSLQQSLYNQNKVYYPKHGIHHYEHIAIPLKLKGLDPWTAQWISQEWVDQEFDALVSEINNSNQTTVISSERLTNITIEQLLKLQELFLETIDIELLLLYRPKEEHIKSIWRHAVYRHDLDEDFSKFSKQFINFEPLDCLKKFSGHFQVHALNIKDKSWEERLNKIISTDIKLTHENMSVPYECCYFLQQIHQTIGSKRFKEYFKPEIKKDFSMLFNNLEDTLIDKFDVPILKPPYLQNRRDF